MATDYPLNELLSDVDEDAYHAAPGVRSSALKEAKRSCSHYVAYTQQVRADTPAFRFGRLAHLAVLEPMRFAQTVHARPDVGDLRTVKGRAALAEWKLGLPPGTQDVSAEEMHHLTGMVHAAHEHPRLKQLLQNGRAEQTLFYDDDAHGLRAKCRYDWVSQTSIICDLKTTLDASLEGFGRDMLRLGYPLSAAHYLEGARVSGVANPDTFVLIAMEKAPPYGIGLYTLGSDVLDWGHQWRHHAMANIGRVVRDGARDGYPDHFQVLELPKWAPRAVDFDEKKGLYK